MNTCWISGSKIVHPCIINQTIVCESSCFTDQIVLQLLSGAPRKEWIILRDENVKKRVRSVPVRDILFVDEGPVHDWYRAALSNAKVQSDERSKPSNTFVWNPKLALKCIIHDFMQNNDSYSWNRARQVGLQVGLQPILCKGNRVSKHILNGMIRYSDGSFANGLFSECGLLHTEFRSWVDLEKGCKDYCTFHGVLGDCAIVSNKWMMGIPTDRTNIRFNLPMIPGEYYEFEGFLETYLGTEMDTILKLSREKAKVYSTLERDNLDSKNINGTLDDSFRSICNSTLDENCRTSASTRSSELKDRNTRRKYRITIKKECRNSGQTGGLKEFKLKLYMRSTSHVNIMYPTGLGKATVDIFDSLDGTPYKVCLIGTLKKRDLYSAKRAVSTEGFDIECGPPCQYGLDLLNHKIPDIKLQMAETTKAISIYKYKRVTDPRSESRISNWQPINLKEWNHDREDDLHRLVEIARRKIRDVTSSVYECLHTHIINRVLENKGEPPTPR